MTDKKLSTEELKQLLEQDKMERQESCRSEIEAILKKHNCKLVALPKYAIDGRTIAEVQIAILP